MKLSEALKTLALARGFPVEKSLALACGFEPLHLKTFLEAHVTARFPGSRLALHVGAYGDLEGNVARAAQAPAEAVAVVLEWGDLDPRLGMRSVGAFSGPKSNEILRDVTERLERLARVIEPLSARARVVVSPPSIPLTFVGFTSGAQHSSFELALDHALVRFLADVARSSRVMVVHPTRLAVKSPVPERHDARSELAVGFPYRLPHASALAELLVALLFPPAPKKALITDLDDTLWAGLVGEVGVDQVGFTQAHGAQLHGLYQLVLRQLADMGVLIGVASKNDPEVVRAALARTDLCLDPAKLFPVMASWGPKSEAVTAMLRTWNLAADAVVFVDDNPMELDEARAVHPELTCMTFPRNDPARAVALFESLRDLFGKPFVTSDDALRTESLRATAAFQAERAAVHDPVGFVRSLSGVVAFRRDGAMDRARALQLLNKTNQFNLNGERVTELALAELIAAEHGFVLDVSYADRYGPLGVVGVVACRREVDHVDVLHWVLSCRAFSRRIEHHVLSTLFDLAEGKPLHLRFARTERNGPFSTFLHELGAQLDAPGPVVLTPMNLREALPHSVAGVVDG